MRRCKVQAGRTCEQHGFHRESGTATAAAVDTRATAQKQKGSCSSVTMGANNPAAASGTHLQVQVPVLHAETWRAHCQHHCMGGGHDSTHEGRMPSGARR